MISVNDDDQPEQPVYSNLGVSLIFLFPALGGLLFGYDIGATSYVIAQLQDEDASGTTWYQNVADSAVLQGTITSSSVGGAFLGSVIVFKVADTIGRRREMQIAAVLYACGAVLEFISGASSYSPTTGIVILLIGRLIYGLACGFAMHGAPSYIAEMSPSHIRGMLVSLKEAMIVVGMLLGYFVGWIWSDMKGMWRYTYVLAVIPAFIMLLGVTKLPPSARWLALKDRMDEALESLRFVNIKGAESVLAEIREQTSMMKSLGTKPLFCQENKRALFAGVGLVTLQQVTGQPSILYYANTIFNDAGMDSYAAVLTGAFKLVATLGSVVAVDRYGRRFLLFVGVSVMLAALIVMTLCFANYESGGDATWRTYMIVIGMFMYIGGYQISFGPIAWLLISEIFPLEVRGEAVAVAVQSNFFWNLVVSFIYPLLVDSFKSLFGEKYGYCAGFALFTILTVYSLQFIYVHIPETSGLSLEEITEKLKGCQENVQIQDGNKPLLEAEININA